jgi:large subunit ribosomal protein L24e
LLHDVQVSEVQRKKRRTAAKATARAIVGVSLEVINKRRTEKPEVRQATRDAALREIKERAKKLKAEKKVGWLAVIAVCSQGKQGGVGVCVLGGPAAANTRATAH